jgi:hypothetical protein
MPPRHSAWAVSSLVHCYKLGFFFFFPEDAEDILVTVTGRASGSPGLDDAVNEVTLISSCPENSRTVASSFSGKLPLA